MMPGEICALKWTGTEPPWPRAPGAAFGAGSKLGSAVTLIVRVGPRAVPAKPRATPASVPAMPTVTVSVRTWAVISRAGQPSALRVPKSQTRRVTDARVSRVEIANDAVSAAAVTQVPRSAARPEAVATAPPIVDAAAFEDAAWSRLSSTRAWAALVPDAAALTVTTRAM